jgi:catechol 2,3-dioxygenase-like lactoylglutathione lyase family enzyme
MKNIILSLIIFFGIILSVQSQNNLKYDHQALPVNNLKSTGDFYIDILGFEDIPTLVGTKESHRWLANYEGKEIHLIFSKEEIQKTPKQIHMAFSPLNFDKFVDHLKMKNVVFTNYKLKEGVVQVRNDGIKQLWIRDPQGYWIEINSTNQD